MKGINGLIVGVFGVVCFVLMVVGTLVMMMGSFLITQENEGDGVTDEQDLVCEGNQVNEDVERYEPHFERYAGENGIDDQVDILMAMTMQESGGQLADVMQSSESMGDPVNTINSPEQSIEQGVSYYADMYEQANGDTELAMQGYNMGGGYIDYVQDNHDGEHSRDVAYEFGEQQASELGWDNYGDEDYVEHVMQYLEDCEETEQESGDGDWDMPVEQVNVTSEFGMRDHPIHNEPRLHAGTDFGCNMGDAIYAVADGTVQTAVQQNTGLGNNIKLQHGSDEYSVYGHLSSLYVSEGDEVQQGDQIGECGSTGDSTGPHLHLEHHTEPEATNDEKEDPAEILDL
ncbi:lysozyme family protein [Natribacillus halophilus]|uniref:Peptidase family M23 n=1 Tax=Natribacillus halophilus TaxID=549003 RepID=A0A1G8PZH5_9BACI|nr:lysozyme family protein [Natribacillus halophilus]SDI97676.1 Peptidase family M23 [Natribacillus halophilus]